MSHTQVSDLSIDEFKAIIREIVSETILDTLHDPDIGLILQDEIKTRLQESVKAVRDGEMSYSAQEVAEELGLEW